MGRFLTLVWAIGGGIGYAGGTALVVISIIKCLFRDPRTVSAEEYRSKRIAGRREKPGRFNPDLGWPIYHFYPFRQVNIDVRRTGVELLKRYGRVWRWLFDAYFRGRHGPRFLWWLFLFIVPLSIGLFALLLFGTLASALAYGFFVATSVVCVGASFAVVWPTSVLLRRAEAYRRQVRFTDASCPTCYLVTPWPAYQCLGCNEMHRDLRPGRLGVLHRRCGCGAPLPTMPLRAAWKLTAFCQRCGTPLPVGAGAVRDIRIPIFGDIAAGKTRFKYASLDSLLAMAAQAGLAAGYPDPRSAREAEIGLAEIRAGDDTKKTSPDLQPAPLSFSLGTRLGQTQAHLFDAAGEVLHDPDRHDDLGYLGLGQALAYVLDPFSIGAVRDRLSGHGYEQVRQAEAAGRDAEQAFLETVSRLRDGGVQASRQRLAVIVSKVDLLRAAEMDVPVASDDIACWLSDSGVHNLVLSAGRDFAEVRYFAVASQAADGSGPRRDDPGAPLRWLLRAHGVRLPAEPEPVPAYQPVGGRPDEHPLKDDMQTEAVETTS